MQLVTNLLSNYTNRAGLGESEPLSDSTSAILHKCTQLKYSTAGNRVHNHLFFITFAHSKVMLAQTAIISSEDQLYIR